MDLRDDGLTLAVLVRSLREKHGDKLVDEMLAGYPKVREEIRRRERALEHGAS